MTQEEKTPSVGTLAIETASDRPPERRVRHVFWKYPLLAFALLIIITVVAALVGSPNWPRDTIAGITQKDPGGAILAFTQELDGTSSSSTNASEYGMNDPGQVFVLSPLRQASSMLGADVQSAVATYDAASGQQRVAWASAYDKALRTITSPAGGSTMGGIMSPDYQLINSLKGDFGPIPVLVKADLRLAQNGFLEQYLQAVEPGHSYHLTNIWLYDHPAILNTALAEGLTDDQWGMIKERGFPVGPWYLIIPAIIHVKIPGGEGGSGFVFTNLVFAFFLLFLVPLVPGLRDLPRYLKLYRVIYHYPVPGELDRPELKERHGPIHGEIEAVGGGE